MKLSGMLFTFYLLFSSLLYGEGEKSIHGSLTIDGKQISYTCTAGYLPILGEDKKPQASLFYIAYHKEQEKNLPLRPITFCFPGGPGASSVWMHLGGLGPKRIDIPNPDAGYPQPPFSYSNNPHTLLDVTDLVFVDPISTGFSIPAAGIEAKTFYSVKEDTKLLAEFIRLYLTHNNLWDAPKFLLGESYGGYRIAQLASYLHNSSYIYLNGLIFLSPAINYQTIDDPDQGNDLPYPLALPSYAAAAWYHHKSPYSSLEESLKQAEAYAQGSYATALFQGDNLTPDEKKKTADSLSKLTGLSPEYFMRIRLRPPQGSYEIELLKSLNQMIGTCDSRYASPIVLDSKPIFGKVDPSAEAYMGIFTSAINAYLTQEFAWQSNEPYIVLTTIPSWDFGQNNNQYASAGDKLRNITTMNPYLRLFVASGYFDLITPYLSIHYSFEHLGLDPSLRSHWEEHRYPAGHLIYLDNQSLPMLNEDLKRYYQPR